jgi:hypothetical protein
MNLGKLLAAGKSIIGGSREISYRISDRAYLPKFISPKNPFVPPARVEPAPVVAAAPIRSGMAADGTKTRKLPVFAKALPRKPGWVDKLNPISFWRDARPPMPEKGQRPLQAELSLDRVKVVHNDLSDADVEIVPIKSRTLPEVAEPILPPAEGGDSWGRLGAKIFGVKAV